MSLHKDECDRRDGQGCSKGNKEFEERDMKAMGMKEFRSFEAFVSDVTMHAVWSASILPSYEFVPDRKYLCAKYPAFTCHHPT